MSDLAVSRHWIDGAWLESGQAGESIDPTTGKVIGRFTVAGPKRRRKPSVLHEELFLKRTGVRIERCEHASSIAWAMRFRRTLRSWTARSRTNRLNSSRLGLPR